MQLDNTVICHFKFICSERWEGLEPIDGYSNKRFCGVCNSPVYLTANYQELEANINEKRCVAIFLDKSMDGEQKFLGLVVPVMRTPYSPDAPDPILMRPVIELEFTADLVEKLQANNVELIGDLAQCTSSQISEQIGATDLQLTEILEVLVSRGLSMGMFIENWELHSKKFR